MLKSVRLKTWVVEGRRDASTVEAMSAAFVDSEAGNLEPIISIDSILNRKTIAHLASTPAP